MTLICKKPFGFHGLYKNISAFQGGLENGVHDQTELKYLPHLTKRFFLEDKACCFTF